ncbi:MAG: multidrug ABC transporter [Eggerthellaceae bacterium]|nr:multidrug ABC transporter [Eggerthellaceae bacterium]
MSPDLLLYSGILLFSAFISAVSQALLKMVAQKKHGSFIREYLNPIVVIAYAIFFISTLLTILAYKQVPLSMGSILESTNYLYVVVFTITIFKEKFNMGKVLALVIIIAGILIFSLC